MDELQQLHGPEKRVRSGESTCWHTNIASATEDGGAERSTPAVTGAGCKKTGCLHISGRSLLPPSASIEHGRKFEKGNAMSLN